MQPVPAGDSPPHRGVAASLMQFRRGLLRSCCQLGGLLAVAAAVVNVGLGTTGLMFLLSVLGAAGFALIALWLRWQRDAVDGPAAALMLFAGSVVAFGWPRFGGLLGSSPALLFPIAGLSLLFTTRWRQRAALAGVVAFTTGLIGLHLLLPGVIDAYYPDPEAQLWDVATSQWLCVLMVGGLFIRMSGHHIQAWEELSRQQAVHVELLRTSAERAQQELRSRLDLTRRMGDGLAHDINNMLTVMEGTADSITSPQELEQRAVIIESVHAAARLVSRFRRNHTDAVEDLDLRVVLASIRRSIACLAPGVSVTVRVGETVPLVEVSRTEFEQVMMNLCLNGVHAMDSSGRLDLSVELVSPAVVAVEVGDTGRGIPEADLENIFKPFFTTRQASGGTGIGLANVKQIVDEWGGRITTRSVLGDGTTFRIEVPCSAQVEGSKRV